MREVIELDLSTLPTHGDGAVNPTWWGTLAFILIEATGFALAIAIYLYLMSLAPAWPIEAPDPQLGPGTIVTAILIVSLIPNAFLLRWVKQQHMLKVRIGVIIMSCLGVAPLLVRVFEFPAMQILWDQNAYGSIVWLLLGLHTTHLITDVVETIILTGLMFTHHGYQPRRFADVADNAMYWNFVVAVWIPVYVCIYWIPRL